MDIEDLLRPIIAQIVNMMNKRVLLFISGGAVNLKDIFETLASMKMLQYDVVMTEAAKKIVPEEYISNLNPKLIDCKVEMTKAVREADIILVPVMTRNTLAKCATGIQDNLVTIGIAEAIMMDKEVMVVTDSYHPQNLKNISLGFSKNPAYNRFILGYQDTLANFGVKFIGWEDLRRSINEKFSVLSSVIQNNYYGSTAVNDRVDGNTSYNTNDIEKANAEVDKDITSKKVLSGILTVEDIMQASHNCKEILVREGAIITPLAKDYIYNKKINVKYC